MRQEFTEVVQRPIAVGAGRLLADDHHVLDSRRIAEPWEHVLQEHVLHDHHARLGGVQDVGDAGAPGGVVNRDLDRAELQDPEPGVEELGAIAHHDRDPIALRHPEVPESRSDTPGALGGLRIRDGVVVEDRKHSIAVAFRVLVDKSRQVHLSLAFPLTLTIVLCLGSEQQARRQRPRACRYRNHLGSRHLMLTRVSS